MLNYVLQDEHLEYFNRCKDFGVGIVDSNGYALFYSEYLGKIENYQPSDVLNKHIFDTFPSVNEDNSTIYYCLKNNIPIYSRVQKYRNKNNHEIIALVTNILLRDDSGVHGVIDIVHDLNAINEKYQHFRAIESSFKNIHHVYTLDDFITCDTNLSELIKKLKNISNHRMNVLIYGETGTGKEIIAQGLHSAYYHNTPFIAENCAAIPENLMESIMFGTEKGSFTGAVDKQGLFELANGGTILLDELNSMPIHLQAKLLRVLQEGCLRRVGGHKTINVDVRVITTVNEDPHQLIQENKLRKDLFYRLSPLIIHIPPLRERKNDIELLFKHYLEIYSYKYNKRVPQISKAVLKTLINHDFPGNVRELINVVEHIVLTLEEGDMVETRHLPSYLYKCSNSHIDIPINNYNINKYDNYHSLLDDIERNIISDALYENKWNITNTADSLKIKRQTLQSKMKRFKLG